MSTINLEAKPQLSKEQRVKINRRRWASYLQRIRSCSDSERTAVMTLTLLMSTINAKERWVRMKEENFLSLKPQWEEKVNADYIVMFNGREFKLHVYYDLKSGKHYFSRFMQRDKNDEVLPDWHVTTCNYLKRRNVPVSKELSGEIFTIGSLIVNSIRSTEGIWR